MSGSGTNPRQKAVIAATADFVRSKLLGEGTGHDWWHIWRVWNLAKKIAQREPVDRFVVELAALLHDIADFKFHAGDETVGPRVATEWLTGQKVDPATIKAVTEAIEDVSFHGADIVKKNRSREGMVVQDADRLDAIGAIGVARCFAFSGHRGDLIYDPDDRPRVHRRPAEYKGGSTTSINHFYEKLLLLKDRLNTPTARQMAERRHQFMEDFLREFLAEWSE